MSTLLDATRFFVNQKAKVFEINTEYKIMAEDGSQIGTIRQEGQSKARKVLRAVSKIDQFLTHKLGVFDADGSRILELVRPGALLKSKVHVSDHQGLPIGSIMQSNLVGKIKFALVGSTGEALGSIDAENWRGWNFTMRDAAGVEVGRITKKWAGIGKEIFTTADNYMVEIDQSVQGELRKLLLASAAGIDLALKQNEA